MGGTMSQLSSCSCEFCPGGDNDQNIKDSLSLLLPHPPRASACACSSAFHNFKAASCSIPALALCEPEALLALQPCKQLTCDPSPLLGVYASDSLSLRAGWCFRYQ